MHEPYENARVLLVGGLGFIGSTLAHLLVNLGAKVTLVDNFLPEHGANWFNIHDIRPQLTVNICDMRDCLAMNQLVQNQDVIFAIAAQTSHSDSMMKPFLDTEINCLGNLSLLEACRHFNPQAKIVYTGTRAFYGSPKELPVKETDPINPKDIYSVNRFAAEQYYLLYYHHYGLRTTSLRLSNIYGPYAQMHHPKYNVLNWFIRLAIEDKVIPIYGEGGQLRDYVYIEDACHAMLLAGVSEPSNGEVFNVGSGQGPPFLEWVQAIVEQAGSGHVEQREWPLHAGKLDVGDFIMDISKIRKTLNWFPSTSPWQGLAKTIAFYRQHQEHYWHSK